MNDTAFSAQTAANANAIPNVPHQEVEAAAQAVVTAAANARAREFDNGSMCAISNVVADACGVNPYDSYPAYLDRAEGVYWISVGGKRFGKTGHPTMGSECTVVTYGSDDPTQPWEQQYEWILEKFQYFHERWSSYPQTMGEHCGTAKTAISSGQMTAIKQVDDVVANWQGRAQQSFRDYFLDPYLVNTLTNQQAVLDELAVAMFSYQALLKKASGDAKKIGDDAAAKLDAMDVGGGVDFNTVLGVIGVVVGAISIVATAGTSTPFVVGLGLVGLGVQATGVAINAEQHVTGANTDELMDNLGTRLDEFKTAMDAEEQTIADSLVTSVGLVSDCLSAGSAMEKGTILPNEPTGDGIPNLTSGEVPTPGDFHPRD